MKPLSETKRQIFTVDPDFKDQRIDNFLRTKLKGVPKSLIYRLIRKRAILCNNKKITPDYRLQGNETITIPELRLSAPTQGVNLKTDQIETLEKNIIFENQNFIAFNKPAGWAVHGGSGLSFGVIEAFRQLHENTKFLELVHRLDKETSGLLLIAKKRSFLTAIHKQLIEKTVNKTYIALVKGKWQKDCKIIDLPLLKNTLSSGERIVKVHQDGKPSKTSVKIIEQFENATLLELKPITGRTHQLRVHCKAQNAPIAGDTKYGDAEFNSLMKDLGCNRLFLHSKSIVFLEPNSGQEIIINCPIDKNLKNILVKLRKHL